MTKKKLTEKSDAFQKLLPVQLTDEEMRHRYEALHTQLDEIDRINAKLQLAKENAKGPLAVAGELIKELRHQLSTKQEERKVECEVHKRFSSRSAETVRLDTCEVVDRRILSAKEMQTELSVLHGGKMAAELSRALPGDDVTVTAHLSKAVPPSKPKGPS